MAAFHRRRLLEVAGEGVPMPEGKDVEHVQLELAVRAAVISTVVSLWNTLDCLASARSLRSASRRRSKTPLSPDSCGYLSTGWRGAGRDQAAGGVERLLSVVDGHRASEPRGWFDWLSAMRNSVVHRPELVPIWLQRRPDPDTPAIHVVGPASATTRPFDLHLRRRPDETDMEMYLISERPPDEVLLAEPAERTLFGMLLSVNELLEDCAALLVRWWREAEATPADFRPPPRAWKLRPSIAGEFRGISPDPSGFEGYGEVVVNDPTMLARVRVAAQIRARQPHARPPGVLYVSLLLFKPQNLCKPIGHRVGEMCPHPGHTGRPRSWTSAVSAARTASSSGT